jgi:hypothetical protein
MVLLAINVGGVAKLDDDTFWRIGPGNVFRARGWTGDEVALTPNPGGVYQLRLNHVATGVSVGVTATQVRF